MISTCCIIIQGEGKGHFSQAMTLMKMLEGKGVKVNHVLLGKNLFRQLPEYFFSSHSAKVSTFLSPNFIRKSNKKGIRIVLSLFVNFLFGPIYLFESVRLGFLLKRSQPEIIFNHYEPLGALACSLFGYKSRHAILSHHFYLSHPDFIHPHGYERSFFWLQWMNFLMQKTARNVFALSFRFGSNHKNITVIPPLIEPSILNEEFRVGERDLCYFLNEGFNEELLGYYRRHPHLHADIFCSQKDAYDPPKNVELHAFSREHFLEKLMVCKRIISTAGFDTAAEAFYYGIPVFLIPSLHHYEQYCNALDAARTGMAYHLDHVDELDAADFESSRNRKYKEWVSSPVWLDQFLEE